MAQSFLVGLMGTGTTASLSPALHMAEGAKLGFSYVFRPIDFSALNLNEKNLAEALEWAERLGYNAMTITHPYKQLVLELLDRVDPVAASLGAVNTVLFTPEGRIGYNTDTSGFASAFRSEMTGVDMAHVVQLGAGGAGGAVADALLRLGVTKLTIVDIDQTRSSALALALQNRHRAEVTHRIQTELASLLAEASGVVHCTPVGMHDHPGTPFDVALLRPNLWVSDIVYRPLETELLRVARQRGCRTLAGGMMAVHQAADAIKLITGISANTERMLKHFRELTVAE